MTTRTDLTYDLRRSPRIVEIASPSTEIVMQDLVDTTRPFEDSFEAMSHPFLMSASGKADLGGGLLVGITVVEKDMKLSFQARTTPAETGTVTTPSGAPIHGEMTFSDSAATFVTNSVVRGSLVVNFTDRSIADVVEVISETQLRTKTLVNGIGNTFDNTDVYHVFNVVQMNVRSGNLTAVDALDVGFPAILPTAFTQVVQSSDTSAALFNNDSTATIVAAMWASLTSANTVAGSFGEKIGKKLLTIAAFLGLK